MNHIGTRHVVQQLVQEHPDKAVDLLVRLCHQERNVQDEVLSYLAQTQTGQRVASSPPRPPLNITFGSSPATSPSSTHRSERSQFVPAVARRQSTNIRPDGVYSPPSSRRTASSVHSHSSRSNQTSTGDYMFLLTTDGLNNVKKLMVKMRTANVRHSLIRDDLIARHKLDINPRPSDYPTVLLPEGYEARVSYCVELQWERQGLDTCGTHSTPFFAVPANRIDTDIILGYEDSGEEPTDADDYQATISPQPQHQHNFVFREPESNIRPIAPSPPARSYHRSTVLSDGSMGHSFARPHHQFVENLVLGQHVSAAAAGTSHISQLSPAATILDSRSVHAHSQRSSASPVTSAAHSPSGPSTTQLRVAGLWDRRKINMWLDLDASGEAFFQAFQQMAVKYKRTFERSTTMIWLRTHENMSDESAHPVELAEDALETDWNDTLEWIHSNKDDRPPHLFAKIEDS